MKSAYLLLDALSIAFPLGFSLTERFGFGRQWKKAWMAVLLSAIPFMAWDAYFVRLGVWGFNPGFILGISWIGLPLEEILFFLAIPFACLFIYQAIRRSPAWAVPPRIALGIWAVTSVSLAFLAAAFAGRVYTLSVAALGAAAAGLMAGLRPRFSGHLLMATLLQYIPFLAVNGILTSLPIVTYQGGQIMGPRIFTIPVEDAIYSFILLALPVAIFESLPVAGKAGSGIPPEVLP